MLERAGLVPSDLVAFPFAMNRPMPTSVRRAMVPAMIPVAMIVETPNRVKLVVLGGVDEGPSTFIETIVE
jgi:hypothetical protein